MVDDKAMLIELEKEEQDTILEHFNSDDLSKMCHFLMNRLDEIGKPVTVRITGINQTLFHYVSCGCTPDKDNWVRRKTNSVLNFGHSSLWLFYKTEKDQNQLIEKYGLSLEDYTISAGAVPILVKDVGMIGVIAVSGYYGLREDHDICLEVLKHIKGGN